MGFFDFFGFGSRRASKEKSVRQNRTSNRETNHEKHLVEIGCGVYAWIRKNGFSYEGDVPGVSAMLRVNMADSFGECLDELTKNVNSSTATSFSAFKQSVNYDEIAEAHPDSKIVFIPLQEKINKHKKENMFRHNDDMCAHYDSSMFNSSEIADVEDGRGVYAWIKKSGFSYEGDIPGVSGIMSVRMANSFKECLAKLTNNINRSSSVKFSTFKQSVSYDEIARTNPDAKIVFIPIHDKIDEHDSDESCHNHSMRSSEVAEVEDGGGVYAWIEKSGFSYEGDIPGVSGIMSVRMADSYEECLEELTENINKSSAIRFSSFRQDVSYDEIAEDHPNAKIVFIPIRK